MEKHPDSEGCVEESEALLDTRPTPANRKRRSYFIIACGIFLACYMVWISTYYVLNSCSSAIQAGHHFIDFDQHGTNCGNSSAEARANGCRFDVMSFSWLKPECYDGELSEQFLSIHQSLGNWHWYVDRQSEQEIPMDKVVQGDMDLNGLYVDMGYHAVHW